MSPATPTVAELVAQHRETLRPSELKVARALLADYPSAGLRTVAALAADAGVSAPTVVRLASALGFDGFRGLQAALHDELRESATPQALRRVRWEPGTGSAAESLLARARLLADRALVSLEALAPSEIDAAVELLSDESRPLVLLGGRFSGFLAEHLARGLEQLRSGVRLLGDPLGSELAALIDLDPRTVCVVVDFHRYQASSIRVAELATQRGASLIVITDERMSPAARLADAVLPVTTDAPAPFYSFTAGVLLAELLLVPVAERLGDAAEQRMTRWDALRGDEFHRGE